MAVMDRTQRQNDPMFFDFGGMKAEGSSMWHLPETVQYLSPEKKQHVEDLKAQEEERINSEIAQAKEQAFQDGLLQGQEQAKQEFNDKLQAIQTQMTQVLNDLQAQLSEQVVQIEKSAVELSITLAEKIIHHAVEINPEYIVPIIEEALGLCGGAIIKKVRVSPEDLEFISIVGLSNSFKQQDGTWEFVADETIKAGCVVETSAGEVEYDINKAWERTKASVTAVLK
jgi:flagellar assembly protein FliH